CFGSRRVPRRRTALRSGAGPASGASGAWNSLVCSTRRDLRIGRRGGCTARRTSAAVRTVLAVIKFLLQAFGGLQMLFQSWQMLGGKCLDIWILGVLRSVFKQFDRILVSIDTRPLDVVLFEVVNLVFFLKPSNRARLTPP